MHNCSFALRFELYSIFLVNVSQFISNLSSTRVTTAAQTKFLVRATYLANKADSDLAKNKTVIENSSSFT